MHICETRVRLLQAHRQAQDHDRLMSYQFRDMSNKQLAVRVELVRKIVADRLDAWTDGEIDDAIAELQGEHRRRKRNAKTAQAEAAKPSAEEKEEIEQDVEEEDMELTLTT